MVETSCNLFISMLLSYGILKGLNPYIERVCFLFETVFRKYKQIHFIYIDGWRIFFRFQKPFSFSSSSSGAFGMWTVSFKVPCSSTLKKVIRHVAVPFAFRCPVVSRSFPVFKINVHGNFALHSVSISGGRSIPC